MTSARPERIQSPFTSGSAALAFTRPLCTGETNSDESGNSFWSRSTVVEAGQIGGAALQYQQVLVVVRQVGEPAGRMPGAGGCAPDRRQILVRCLHHPDDAHGHRSPFARIGVAVLVDVAQAEHPQPRDRAPHARVHRSAYTSSSRPRPQPSGDARPYRARNVLIVTPAGVSYGRCAVAVPVLKRRRLGPHAPSRRRAAVAPARRDDGA